MRLIFTKGRKTAAAAAAVAACTALVVGVQSATAASGQAQPDHSRQCVDMHLYEVMLHWYANGPVSHNLPVGFQSTWFDGMYDWTTRDQLGTSTGALDIMYQRASDGHEMQYLWEQAQFPEGTMALEGPYDRTDVVSFKWVGSPAKGLSGKYAGWTGYWQWRLIVPTTPNTDPPFEDMIHLCAPAHGH